MNRIAGALFGWMLALGLAFPAHADEAADRAAIQSLITAQIEAFRADDGAAAYGFASPMIQSVFPSPEAFMAMVKNGYPQVYRPRSVTFGMLVNSASGPIQQVFVVGPDGVSYIAAYTLERQPDGTWKINGCTILKDNSPTI